MSTRGEPGTVYTLHFDPPYRPSPDVPQYKTAGHYTGWAADLDARLAEHDAGRGARLTQVQKEAGGSWRLASAEPGTRADERRLKQHGAARRCPICKDEAQISDDGPHYGPFICKEPLQPEPERELEAGLWPTPNPKRDDGGRTACRQRPPPRSEPNGRNRS